ncbi:MAG: UrcA family protein [Pseudomonadota bacterium]
MKKLVFSLTAVCVAFSPVALAEEEKEVSVTIEYDMALLDSDAGAEVLMAAIEDQARDACKQPSTSYFTGGIDSICVDEVMSLAALKISEERAKAGQSVPREFAALAKDFVAQ